MADMTAEPVDLLALAHRRPLTIADLPEEDEVGRTELIEGNLHVTPMADFEHQKLASDILYELRDVAPEGMVVVSPVNVIASEATLVIPDVAVVDPGHLVRRGLGVAPDGVLLAVEITSPSTRTHDLTVKRELYSRWQVPYLLVDRRTTPFDWKMYGACPAWARVLLP